MTPSSESRPLAFGDFRTAMEAQDVAAWVRSYSDDAEWLEYKHSYPPSA